MPGPSEAPGCESACGCLFGTSTALRVIFVTTGTSYISTRPWSGEIDGVAGFDHNSFAAWQDEKNDGLIGTFAQRNGEFITSILIKRALALAGKESDGANRPMPDERCTAEVVSLDAIFREDVATGRAAPRRIVFLPSGNAAGRLGGQISRQIAAEVWAKRWCTRFGLPPGTPCEMTVEPVEHLDAKDAEAFAAQGSLCLADAVIRHLPPHGVDRQVDFNITGGFKGTVPFIELIAIACSGYVRYLYEGATRPIGVPCLQVERLQFRDPHPAYDAFIDRLQSIHEDPTVPPHHAEDRE